jgi:hypothetical protein
MSADLRDKIENLPQDLVGAESVVRRGSGYDFVLEDCIMEMSEDVAGTARADCARCLALLGQSQHMIAEAERYISECDRAHGEPFPIGVFSCAVQGREGVESDSKEVAFTMRPNKVATKKCIFACGDKVKIGEQIPIGNKYYPGLQGTIIQTRVGVLVVDFAGYNYRCALLDRDHRFIKIIDG